MTIDIHSHLMSVAFLGHLQGRDTLPTAARDTGGFTAHCAPLLSLPYRAPILSVEAKLADMDAAGTDLAVLAHGTPGPASAEELQRAACAVMAFGFAEVVTVDQVLSRIPAAVTA